MVFTVRGFNPNLIHPSAEIRLGSNGNSLPDKGFAPTGSYAARLLLSCPASRASRLSITLAIKLPFLMGKRPGSGLKNQRKNINRPGSVRHGDYSGPVFPAKTQVVFYKFFDGHDEKLQCIKVVLKGLSAQSL